ncbi:hypothetical protein [Nostoc sp.]|uniref:hypothetical protein n=1 Tax=Nostoc sp. TaxID=1180 RepID=UPI002FF770FC
MWNSLRVKTAWVLGWERFQYRSPFGVMSKDTESVELVVVQKLENALSAKIEAYFPGSIDSPPDVLEELLRSKNSEGTRRGYRRDITDFFVRMTGQPPQRDSILEFLHLSGHKATQVVTKSGLTQKLSQTLIPLCSLRPLRFVFWSFCVSPINIEPYSMKLGYHLTRLTADWLQLNL